MCGIFGIYSPRGADLVAVRRGLSALHHRGPDAQGIWSDPTGCLALGHRRLKILDLSDDANQPMRSADGRWTLAFNGEIVNYRDLRTHYNGPWHFRTKGDSEVLLATFARLGIEAMHDWVGMFAYAIHDAETNKLTLARDRFGIKPLYLIDLPDGGLAFASEIPPLLPLLPKVRADEDVIRTYLETGLYDHTERTFFAGITALSQGTALQLDLTTKSRSSTKWYNLLAQIPDLSHASLNELVEVGTRHIARAVEDHLIADVKVGLNVSGGVDSSVLVALAKERVADIHLFTQDFEEPYSEAVWVRQVADGCTLHIAKLDFEAISARLIDVVRTEAEPFGGVSVIAYDALYRDADRAGVTVLLDGNGVDESFLGYKKYHADYVSCATSDADWHARASGYQRFWNDDAPTRSRPPRTGRAIDGTISVQPAAIAGQLQRASRLLPPLTASVGDGIKASAIVDLLATKIPRGLRFNDRMSMRRSKELRVPFLDHRVVEFAAGVPPHYLLNEHGSKAVFRQIAGKHIPPGLSLAPKRSVQSPQREWLRGQWRPLVERLLSSSSFADRGWVNQSFARTAYSEYLTGTADNSFFIWQWLNLELWAQEFLD